MGWRYVYFRASYAIKVKLGILKWFYPTKFVLKDIITLNDWREKSKPFFFESKESIPHFAISLEAKRLLETEFKSFLAGDFTFFNHKTIHIGVDYDWLSNPDTGAKYDINTFWANVPDLDPIKGDIKYVWEKSRFSFLYLLVRYDFHFKNDQSQIVFDTIEDWIDRNKLNSGPNYKCSQEISLRVLNWVFVLYYYKNSNNLTESRFKKIISSIYWQLKHVELNINFSRIAVRNNHAITETLTIYIIGVLFPWIDESKKWKEVGKRYFEEEVKYQIYDDGSFLQFSHNYHRVAAQLFTWAQVLSKNNLDKFSDSVLERFNKTFKFLYAHQDGFTGNLPNYGANDGALFFKLNSAEYRNFYPQLNALYFSLKNQVLTNNIDWCEDIFWYGAKTIPEGIDIERNSTSGFKQGGFYVLRNDANFATIRCGSHKDRPQQADNLTLDIWHEGKNLIRDNGSYKYNTDPEMLNYFTGTASHNTIMLGDHNQMQKGGRFIWFYWSQAISANVNETDRQLFFEGEIEAYKQINSGIIHKRRVVMNKTIPQWDIEDRITYSRGHKNDSLIVKQLWHLHPDFFDDGFEIEAVNEFGHPLVYKIIESWHSSFYGVKERSKCLVFENVNGYFYTTIKKSDNKNGNV